MEGGRQVRPLRMGNAMCLSITFAFLSLPDRERQEKQDREREGASQAPVHVWESSPLCLGAGVHLHLHPSRGKGARHPGELAHIPSGSLVGTRVRVCAAVPPSAGELRPWLHRRLSAPTPGGTQQMVGAPGISTSFQSPEPFPGFST